MCNLLRLAKPFGNRSPNVKIGIIGLSSVGKRTLLQRLSPGDLRVVEHPQVPILKCELGRSRLFNMNFVSACVGYSEKSIMKKWTADQFCDSDGIIFIIDDDQDVADEAIEWFKAYVNGFHTSHGPQYWIKCREGIPWVILGNQKKPDSWLTVEEISRRMRLESLDIDLHVEVVNILTGEGVDNAISWLRKRLDDPTRKRENMPEMEMRQEGPRLAS